MLVLLGFSIGAGATTITVPTPPAGVSTYVDTPTGVVASLGYKKVIVSWNAVTTPIRYYRVEASSDGGKKWYAGPVTRATTISLNLPSKNILITYRVVAVGYKSLSLPSELASITVK